MMKLVSPWCVRRDRAMPVNDDAVARGNASLSCSLRSDRYPPGCAAGAVEYTDDDTAEKDATECKCVGVPLASDEPTVSSAPRGAGCAPAPSCSPIRSVRLTDCIAAMLHFGSRRRSA
jgi:hypothetical protein